MTYKELLAELQQLNEEQLNQDVAVYHDYEGEYYQSDVEFVFATEECMVLDVDHPIIRFWWHVTMFVVDKHLGRIPQLI